MEFLKIRIYRFLRWTEKYTKTDMVYMARGGLWMNFNYVITSACAFGLSVVFAHMLTKESYGVYQLIISIGSISSAFTLTGINTAVTHAVARGFEGTVRASIPVQLKYNTLSLICTFGLSAYYLFNHNSQLATGIFIIGLFIPILNAYNTYTALISGRKDFKGGFMFSMALTLPYTLLMAAALLFVHDPVILVSLNFFLNALIAYILYRRALAKYAPNSEVDTEALGYGKHLSLAAIIGTAAAQVDNLLAFHYVGTAALATYALASTIPERASGALKSITVMAFPKLAERSHAELKGTALMKSMRLAALTAAISLVYVACAPFIFHIFFPKYISAIAYSQGYALALICSTLASMPLTILTAMRAKKEIYIYNIASPLINIGLMVPAAAVFGLWGLIGARAGSGLINYLISLALIHRSTTA